MSASKLASGKGSARPRPATRRHALGQAQPRRDARAAAASIGRRSGRCRSPGSRCGSTSSLGDGARAGGDVEHVVVGPHRQAMDEDSVPARLLAEASRAARGASRRGRRGPRRGPASPACAGGPPLSAVSRAPAPAGGGSARRAGGARRAARTRRASWRAGRRAARGSATRDGVDQVAERLLELSPRSSAARPAATSGWSTAARRARASSAAARWS